PPIRRCRSAPSHQGVCTIIDVDDEVGIEADLGGLTPRRIANVLVNTDEHCVGLVIIVAVLGRSMKEASDAGMALEIDVERRHELRHGEPPLFVDEPSDSRQAIGRVRIAVGLESASQVAYPSREHGLSTGYTVVVQHGEVQE